MKRVLLLLFLTLGSAFALEPIDGFRDMKFGDPIEKLGDFKALGEKYGFAYWTGKSHIFVVFI